MNENICNENHVTIEFCAFGENMEFSRPSASVRRDLAIVRSPKRKFFENRVTEDQISVSAICKYLSRKRCCNHVTTEDELAVASIREMETFECNSTGVKKPPVEKQQLAPRIVAPLRVSSTDKRIKKILIELLNKEPIKHETRAVQILAKLEEIRQLYRFSSGANSKEDEVAEKIDHNYNINKIQETQILSNQNADSINTEDLETQLPEEEIEVNQVDQEKQILSKRNADSIKTDELETELPEEEKEVNREGQEKQILSKRNADSINAEDLETEPPEEENKVNREDQKKQILSKWNADSIKTEELETELPEEEKEVNREDQEEQILSKQNADSIKTEELETELPEEEGKVNREDQEKQILSIRNADSIVTEGSETLPEGEKQVKQEAQVVPVIIVMKNGYSRFIPDF